LANPNVQIDVTRNRTEVISYNHCLRIPSFSRIRLNYIPLYVSVLLIFTFAFLLNGIFIYIYRGLDSE